MASVTQVDDRTARARIRDAAIACIAADGADATRVRDVAERAGVSPGLVIHHFGSKDGLRAACDEHVVAVIRSRKHQAMAAGTSLDMAALLHDTADDPPLAAYLARTLVDGSPRVARLFDEIVEDAVVYLEEGVRSGMLRPTDDARARAVVLSAWTLGALVLHEHVERLLGVDLAGAPADVLREPAYMDAVLGLLGDGLFTPGAVDRMRAALREEEAS